MSESQSSEPEAYQPPYAYVNELIKLTQKMAPNATNKQWNQFGLIARKVELSHEYYLNKAYHSANDQPLLKLQAKMEKMEDEIFNLQESIFRMALSQEETDKELSSTKKTNEELNKELDILQKQVVQMMADEDAIQEKNYDMEVMYFELHEKIELIKKKVDAIEKTQASTTDSMS